MLKFHYATPLGLCATVEARNGSKGYKNFFAFLCVSEHFESIETHLFFFENFREREAQNACERSEHDASMLDVLELRSDRLYQSFLKDHSQLFFRNCVYCERL